jgi:hypothetical protein
MKKAGDIAIKIVEDLLEQKARAAEKSLHVAATSSKELKKILEKQQKTT